MFGSASLSLEPILKPEASCVCLVTQLGVLDSILMDHYHS